jgi:hypothetical protein
MGKRVNFTISDVQVERMQELCDLHGYSNVSQCCKYLLQRGLTIECSTAGILTTNDRLGDIVDAFNTSVADTVVPPQSLKFENNTSEMDFENDQE